MAKESKFFRIYKKKSTISDKPRGPENDSDQKSLQNEIDKAVRFIKVKQFHSGFTEIFSPEKGGDIEVSIEQDKDKHDHFHVNFRFLTIPGRTTLFSEQKTINYNELQRLANEYEKHKDDIEEELNYRDEKVKGLSA